MILIDNETKVDLLNNEESAMNKITPDHPIHADHTADQRAMGMLAPRRTKRRRPPMWRRNR